MSGCGVGFRVLANLAVSAFEMMTVLKMMVEEKSIAKGMLLK